MTGLLSDDPNSIADIDVDPSLEEISTTIDSSNFVSIDTQADPNDLDVIKVGANDKDKDEHYSDCEWIYKEFKKIQKKHAYSATTPTDDIRTCLLCMVEIDPFSCGGAISDAPLPGLYIDEIGYIGFPLVEEQIKRIIEKSKIVPFGRKEKAIFDENIQHTWQMESSQFTIKNSKWVSAIDSLVNHVCNKLRYHSKAIKHILHKLRIYEPGSFFELHHDIEKDDGTFGTLVVALPSVCSGGQLVVRHCGRECEYDFNDIKNTFEVNFAAFYTDCEHEIKPVLAGYRICLIYNLVSEGTRILPKNTAIFEAMVRSSIDWVVEADECPALLVCGLEHRYPNEGLSFDSLKGKDIEIAQLINKVSASVPLNISLENIKGTLVDGTQERTSIVFSPKYIKYHKFLREIAKKPGAKGRVIKCLNTLEGPNHRGATLVFIWWLNISDFPDNRFYRSDIFDLFCILFRHGYEDLAIDFVHYVKIHGHFYGEHLVDLVWILRKEFPTISTLAFRELVSYAMWKIRDDTFWLEYREILRIKKELRELLDVDFPGT